MSDVIAQIQQTDDYEHSMLYVARYAGPAGTLQSTMHGRRRIQLVSPHDIVKLDHDGVWLLHRALGEWLSERADNKYSVKLESE